MGGEALHDFIASSLYGFKPVFSILQDLMFCVPKIFCGGEFFEKFVETWT